MKKTPVKLLGDFIPPAFFSKLENGTAVGTVGNPKQIEIGGALLEPISDEFVVGEKYKVGYSGNRLYIQYLSDIERNRQEREEIRQLKQQAEELKARQKSVAFWAQYQIPVPFVVEIKEVLSGLQQNSNGCGINRKSVTHLYLKADLVDGRLVRPAGSFLCSPVKARYGGDWTGTLGEGLTMPYTPIVSCKQCLKKMEKWKLKSM